MFWLFASFFHGSERTSIDLKILIEGKLSVMIRQIYTRVFHFVWFVLALCFQITEALFYHIDAYTTFQERQCSEYCHAVCSLNRSRWWSDGCW